VVAFASNGGGGLQLLGISAPAWTGADGRYRLEGVRADVPLRIEAVKGDSVPVRRNLDPLAPGELRTGVDIQFREGAGLLVRYAGDEGEYLVRCDFEGEGPNGEAVEPMFLFLVDGEAETAEFTPGTWNLVLMLLSETPEDLAERRVELRAGERNTVEF
jgi:hypothetical protein